MCGVFGYIGQKDPVAVCLNGLELLEYRGYDSTGIAGIHNGKIAYEKKAGKLSKLKESLSLLPLELAIAHTRWATHGKVNDKNAHPHLDASGSLALIHNGIIENYDILKAHLEKEGVVFSSETDTEVLSQLFAKHYNGDLVQTTRKLFTIIRGYFAFLVIHKNHPDQIIAAARGCPLSIAINLERSESMISSDPNAFLGSPYDVIFLQENEIALVHKGAFEIFDGDLHRIERNMYRMEISGKVPSKEGFEHFMLKEIFDQPTSIRKALNLLESKELVLPSHFEQIEQISILGCGTSFHAGLLGSMLFEDIAKIPARAEIASEARYRIPIFPSKTLTIALSQSGETADTLAALRDAKQRGYATLALCNVPNSAIAREADQTIFLQAGPEVSVCSTKAFTSQCMILTLLVLKLAKLKQTISLKQFDDFIEQLQKIPSHIEQILSRSKEIEGLAKKYAHYRDFFYMGRRYMFPTCLEAALKLKEISYVNANGYPAGELKHGPIALLDANFPVIAFCAHKKTEEKILNNLMEIKARNAPLLAIAPDSMRSVSSIANDYFFVPSTLDSFAPFLSTIVGQLFAYFIAKVRGCDIDQPRNLAKSVTVE